MTSSISWDNQQNTCVCKPLRSRGCLNIITFVNLAKPLQIYTLKTDQLWKLDSPSRAASCATGVGKSQLKVEYGGQEKLIGTLPRWQTGWKRNWLSF